MTTTPFDSPLYRALFSDTDTARLFTDTAELRAMLLTWGALAIAQSKHGLIPQTAAHAIQKAAMEVQVDPAALTSATARDGDPIPALAEAFRTEMKAPEHAAYLHFGATSQDIIDTALSLRLRQVLGLIGTRLTAITTTLGTLAKSHANTPIAGRTSGQITAPTSFGALVASWGAPLLDLHQDIRGLPEKTLLVSLSGTTGSLAALHPHGPAIRADLAKGLGLHDPKTSWHSNRSSRARLSGWLTQITVQLGKIGADIAQMTSSSQQEISLTASPSHCAATLPQNQNPVHPMLLQTLASHTTGLNATMQQACVHTGQHDAAAWMTEWLTLPQICCAAGRALAVADTLTAQITANTARMAANIDDGSGLIFAKTLEHHLCQSMPRPEAQELVKQLCTQALETGTHLQTLAAETWPNQTLDAAFTPHLGHAPDDALAFAQTARQK